MLIALPSAQADAKSFLVKGIADRSNPTCMLGTLAGRQR